MRIKFWEKESPPAFFQDLSQEPSVDGVEGMESEPFQPYSVEMSATAKKYNSAASWIVTIGVFLLPLFFLPWTSNVLELNKQVLLVAVAGISLVVWLLGLVISGQMVVRPNPLDKGIGALLLATILTTAFSLVRTGSLFGLSIGVSESLVSVLAMSVMYFVAVHASEDGGKRLRTALMLSTLVALAYGLAQFFTVYVLNLGVAHSRAFNSVGSINALGVLAGLSLPFFYKIKLRIKGVPYFDAAKLGMAVAAAILVVLNWWVLWTIAIAGMLGVIALDSLSAVATQDQRWKVSRFLLPMTVIGVGVFLLIVKFTFTPVRSNLPVEVSPSFSLATSITNSVLKERLVFGYGPENYSLAFDRYGAKSLANTTLADFKFYDAPAQIFNWATQGGVVMLLAVLFLFWTLGEGLLKAYRQQTHQAESGEFTAVVSTLLAFVVAMFLYPFNLALFVVLYVCMALLVLNVWGDRMRVMNIEDKPVVSLASSIGFIIGLILVLAGSYFVALRYVSDVTYAQSLKETKGTDAIATLVRAINLNGEDDRYYRAISQATLGILRDEINKKPDPKDTERPARIQNYIQSSMALARRATEINPLESANWFNLGTVDQALVGLVDNVDRLAEDAYLKAAELRPGDASFYNRIGSMYLARGDLLRQLAPQAGSGAGAFLKEANASLAKAETYFKKAIETANTYGLAMYNLGAVYDRQGKVQDAIKQLETIIPYNADQPSLLFELGLLYYRAGRKGDSIAAFQRAVLLAPQYANARWYLALLLEERKDIPGAISQLESILETNSDNQTVKDKIAHLKAGQIVIPPGKVTDFQPLDAKAESKTVK